MEPVEYLRLLRRRWHVVVLAALVALAVASLLTMSAPAAPEPLPSHRMFTATHTLYQWGGTNTTSAGISLDTLALLGSTGVIPQRVVERLDLDVEPALLASEVRVTADSRVGTITISSTQADGERAALLANAFAEEILAFVAERSEQTRVRLLEETSAQLTRQEERIRELDRQLAGLPESSIDRELLRAERDGLIRQYGVAVERYQQLVASGTTSSLGTLQSAVPIPVLEDVAFQPPTSRAGRLVVAGLVGLVLGAVLVLVLDRFDTKVRTRRGAEHAFGLPVVAEIPRLGVRQRRASTIIVRDQPASVAAEAYRALRLALQLMPRWVLPPQLGGEEPQRAVGQLQDDGTASARVVVVTSALAGDGKTSTVANLAASFAEIGKSVLVVDCDVRNPQLHRLLKVSASPGVSDYLMSGPNGPSLHQLAQKSALRGVSVIAGGSSMRNPGELLGPDQHLIAAAEDLAEVVIVDTGPVLAASDCTALVPDADAVVVVARSGRTTGEAAYRTRELLARVQAPVLGVVLTRVATSMLGSRSRHQSGHRRRDGNGARRQQQEGQQSWSGPLS